MCQVMNQGQGPARGSRQEQKEIGTKMGLETVTAGTGTDGPGGAEMASWAMEGGFPVWLGTSRPISSHRANMSIRLSHENIKDFTGAVVFDIYHDFVAFPRPVIEIGLFVCFSLWLLAASIFLGVINFLLQTTQELNPILMWSRDLMSLFVPLSFQTPTPPFFFFLVQCH